MNIDSCEYDFIFRNETFNTIDAEISGLLHTGNPNVNSNFVYLPLDIVQQSLNVDKMFSKFKPTIL